MKVHPKFNPIVFRTWGLILKTLSEHDRSEILLAISLFPDYEPKDVPLWAFFKTEIGRQAESYTSACEAKTVASRKYRSREKTTPSHDGGKESSDDSSEHHQSDDDHMMTISNDEMMTSQSDDCQLESDEILIKENINKEKKIKEKNKEIENKTEESRIEEKPTTVVDSHTSQENKEKNTLLNSNSTANTQTVRRSTSSILRGTFDAPLFAPFKSEVPDYIDPNSLERPERAKKNEWTDAPERATNTLAKLQAEEQASAVSFSFLFSSSLFCPDEYHSYAVAICRANGVDPTDALIDRIWDAFKESITNKDEKRSLKAWRSGWASLVNKVCQTTSKGAQA